MNFSNSLLVSAILSLGALAEQGAINIETLEEIPRDQWPDLTIPGMQIAPLRGNQA